MLPSSFPLKNLQPCFIFLPFLISSPNYLIRITDSAKQEHKLQEGKKIEKGKIRYKTIPPNLLSVGLNEKCFVPRLDPSGFRLFESINLRHGRDRQLESGTNSYGNYSVQWPPLVHWTIARHEGETRAALNQGSGNPSIGVSFFPLLFLFSSSAQGGSSMVSLAYRPRLGYLTFPPPPCSRPLLYRFFFSYPSVA